jgi:dihydroorotate dehydrogenase
LFTIDPEKIHDFTINFGNKISNYSLVKFLIKKIYYYENDRLSIRLFNINFKNPVGLAAGFDKNALLTQLIPYFGFGFMEIGSVTANSYSGNPKPRLIRLVKDKALVVYYGLKNDGALKISKYLKNKKPLIPLGISIAKTNDKTIIQEKAIKDYCMSFKLFKDIGNYTILNISCPNTSDGTTFCHNSLALEKLLNNINKIETKKPTLLKISPDINEGQLIKVIGLSKKYNIKGLIISNISKKRDKLKLKTNKKILDFYGYSGISGKPMQAVSNKLIRETYILSKGKIPIIGSGGVFNANDAYEKIKLGSSLLQVITGMIYEGPSIVKNINKGLIKLMNKDKFENLKEAIGYGVK